VSTFGGGAISWKSTKKTNRAHFIMEAEFISVELASQEAKWLKNLLVDMPLWGRQTTTFSLHRDSQVATGVAHNYMYNYGKKGIRHSVLKKMLKHGVISLEYVRSERNLADPLTKGLTRESFSRRQGGCD